MRRRTLASSVHSTMRNALLIGMVLLLGTITTTESFTTTRPTSRNVIVPSSRHHQLPAPMSVQDSRPGGRSMSFWSASPSSSCSSVLAEGQEEEKKNSDVVLRRWWRKQRSLRQDGGVSNNMRDIFSNNKMRASSTAAATKKHIRRRFMLPRRATAKSFASELVQCIVTSWTQTTRRNTPLTQQPDNDRGHRPKQRRSRRFLASLVLAFSIWQSNHRLWSSTASATAAHAAVAAASIKTPWNLVRTVSSTQQQVTTTKGERAISHRESSKSSPSPLSRPSVILVGGSISIYAVHQKQKQYVQQQQQLLHEQEEKRRDFQSDLKRNIMIRTEVASSPSSQRRSSGRLVDPKSEQERVQEMLERVKKAQGAQPALRRTKPPVDALDDDNNSRVGFKNEPIAMKVTATASTSDSIADPDGPASTTSETEVKRLSTSSMDEVPVVPPPPGVGVAVAVAASSSLVDDTPQPVAPSTTSELDATLALATEQVPVVPSPPPGVGVAVAVSTASSFDDTQTVVQSLKSVSGKSVESELDVVSAQVVDDDDATTATHDLSIVDDEGEDNVHASLPSDEAEVSPTARADGAFEAVAASAPPVEYASTVLGTTVEGTDVTIESIVGAATDVAVPASSSSEAGDARAELEPVVESMVPETRHLPNDEVVPIIKSWSDTIVSKVPALEDDTPVADEEHPLDVIYLTDKDLATEPTIGTTTLSQTTAEETATASSAVGKVSELDASALSEETSRSTLHYATQNSYLESLEESTQHAQLETDSSSLREVVGTALVDNAEPAIAAEVDAVLEAPVAKEAIVESSASHLDEIVAEKHAVVSPTTDDISVDAATTEASHVPSDDSTNVHDAPSTDSFPAWIREKVRSKRQLQQQGRSTTIEPPVQSSSTSPIVVQVSSTTSVATAVSSVTDSVTALASRASTIVAPIRSTSRMILEAPMIIPKLVTTDKYVRARHQPKNPAEEDALSQKYAAIPTLEERAYIILKDLGMLEGSDDIETIH